MIAELLVKDEFKQWLVEMDDNVSIGDINDGTDCPMAQFLLMRISQEELTDQVDELCLGIHFLDYVDLEEDAQFQESMPQWSINFYNELCHRFGFVTVHDCLMALENIENVN